MDKKKQISMMTKHLLLHTFALRKRIESHESQIPYREGFVKTLLDIERVLSSQPLDIDRLRLDCFGIFRMVDGFADTPIEQELMLLHDEIDNLLKAIKEINNHQR